MAVDEALNERFRRATKSLDSVTEANMMGGTCFMLNGNMLGGADRPRQGSARFMFRVGKDQEAEALARAGALPMEQAGRRMRGMIFVDAATVDARALSDWVRLATRFVGALPPK